MLIGFDVGCIDAFCKNSIGKCMYSFKFTYSCCVETPSLFTTVSCSNKNHWKLIFINDLTCKVIQIMIHSNWFKIWCGLNDFNIITISRLLNWQNEWMIWAYTNQRSTLYKHSFSWMTAAFTNFLNLTNSVIFHSSIHEELQSLNFPYMNTVPQCMGQAIRTNADPLCNI